RFTLMVIMHLNETIKECSTRLGFAMVDHLGDFQVTLGDSGFFSPSVERVDDIVLDWLVPDIEEAINSHLRPIAMDMVQKYSDYICSYFL
ncbi:hypothetical protein, partial [Klebsiella pneumoniae]|uniref:hypothetical protein n=1 Tax=Klebsiella pneumoniae TaxID=573 RepID=UPI0040554F19